MCEKCRLIELFDEELARFESGEAFSIARHRYALERRGISEGRAMVIAHSEPFQGPTPPSREEQWQGQKGGRVMKKVINGLDKGTTAWFDDNDNPTLVHIKQEIGGQCESVLLFGWEIDVIHKHTRADLTDALAEAAEEVIKSATGAYNEKRTNVSKDKFKKLKDALAAYRGEK